MSAVDKCRNMFGPLNAECRSRLQRVLDSPTAETWDDAYSLIVGADGFTTLWQAWVKVDSSAPRAGPCHDMDGNQIRGWPRIPDQLTLYRALKAVT